MRDIVERINELRAQDSDLMEKDDSGDPQDKAYEMIQSYGMVEKTLGKKVSLLMNRFEDAKKGTAQLKKSGAHYQTASEYVKKYLLPDAKKLQDFVNGVVKELEKAAK